MITNGVSLTAQSLLIGNQPGATGTAPISGAGSTATINQGAGGIGVNSGGTLTVGALEMGPVLSRAQTVSSPLAMAGQARPRRIRQGFHA